MGLSALWLLLLWILPFRAGKPRSTLRNLPHYLIYPLKLVLRFWRYSHKLFALALLVILVCGGGLAYAQLASPQSYLNQFATSDGHLQWQRSAGGSAAQLAMADAQGSIAITSAGKSLHQLTSLDLNGVSRWTSFPSEGTFSLPTVSTQPGTVLVALSGPISLPYQFAPDDPAYAHSLDSLYMLYLLDRQTGQIIWQNMIVPPGEQQDTAVLGADAKFIYVASRATSSFIPGIEPVVQLIAVNKTTGSIEWRIFGPHEPASASADFGSLLLRGRSIIWQVANTIYALDSMLGQIQWSRYIANSNPYEESQMAETEGILLVARSDLYHALDPATGNESWTIANPGIDTLQTPGGIAAANHVFLIYGGGALLAIDPVNQHIIWSQKQLEAIQGLKVSDDNTTVYAIKLSHITGSPATQVLAALDVQTGAIRWTFQAPEQESFIHGFQYSQNTLYATVCLSGNQASCGHEILYAINATTGEAGWKFEANSIYNVRVSLDSSTVVFQTNNSAWGNLIEHFKPT
jgi:outer membrane protein assembly factor BamB